MSFSPSSKARLTRHDLGRFADETLFSRLGRAVCRAECLPRKELYESWEMARRVRRLFRGGRVVDVGGGHGLLAHTMLLLDDTSPCAVVVDPALPPSSTALHEALVEAWPRLAGRVEFLARTFDEFVLDELDVVVTSHGCGSLTDRVLERAASARVRVAVLPCCHDLKASETRGLSGWVEKTLAVDIVRAGRLAAQGYRIWTQTIPAAITPRNRLLLAAADARHLPRSEKAMS